MDNGQNAMDMAIKHLILDVESPSSDTENIFAWISVFDDLNAASVAFFGRRKFFWRGVEIKRVFTSWIQSAIAFVTMNDSTRSTYQQSNCLLPFILGLIHNDDDDLCDMAMLPY